MAPEVRSELQPGYTAERSAEGAASTITATMITHKTQREWLVMQDGANKLTRCREV